VDRTFPFLRLAYFLAVCLAVGMVTGACRATTLGGVLRKSVETFIELAAGIAALVLGIWLLQLVAQA
jgi:hypothetical protein